MCPLFKTYLLYILKIYSIPCLAYVVNFLVCFVLFTNIKLDVRKMAKRHAEENEDTVMSESLKVVDTDFINVGKY